MLTCYSLVERFKLRVLFIFVSVSIIKCDSKNNLFAIKEEDYCPFVETLSFGSDIDIKCNNSYLMLNNVNNTNFNWKFANQSSFCNQEGFVNQCSIISIDSKYLKVQLKSLIHNERACVYCPINYKPIAPMIIVNRSDDGHHIFYTFSLTAPDHSESFEILWAKRASHVSNSFNYWFLQKCIDRRINILENTGHTIIFTVDDVDISRVEFIIRRCNDTCRSYQRCYDEEFDKEISSNSFQTPDSIEKISCNYKCLNGIVSTTTTTIHNIIKENTSLSTNQLSYKMPPIKFLILFSILGLLIVLMFIILGFFIISKIKGLRTDNVYTKTSNINLDENKGNLES